MRPSRLATAIAATCLVAASFTAFYVIALRPESYRSFIERNQSDKYLTMARPLFHFMVEAAGADFNITVNESCSEGECLSIYLVDHSAIRDSENIKFKYLSGNAIFIAPNIIAYDEQFFEQQMVSALNDSASYRNFEAILQYSDESDLERDKQINVNRVVHNVIKSATFTDIRHGRDTPADIEEDLMTFQTALNGSMDDMEGRGLELVAMSTMFALFHEVGHYVYSKQHPGPVHAGNTRELEDFADSYAAGAFKRVFERIIDRSVPRNGYSAATLRVVDAALSPVRTFLLYHKLNMFDGFRGFEYADLLYDTYSEACREYRPEDKDLRPLNRGSTHNNIAFIRFAAELSMPLMTRTEFNAAREKLIAGANSTHAYPLSRADVILDNSITEATTNLGITEAFRDHRDAAIIQAIVEDRPKEAAPTLNYGNTASRTPLPFLEGISDLLRTDPILQTWGIPASTDGRSHYEYITFRWSEGVNCPTERCRVWEFLFNRREPFMYLESIETSSGALQYRLFYQAEPLDNNAGLSGEEYAGRYLKRIAVINILNFLMGKIDHDVLGLTIDANIQRRICGAWSFTADLGNGRAAFISNLEKSGWWKATFVPTQ